MTFVGVCMKQTCFLTSEDLLARTSTVVHYNAVISCILFLLIRCSCCELDIAFDHIAISIIVLLIV